MDDNKKYVVLAQALRRAASAQRLKARKLQRGLAQSHHFEAAEICDCAAASFESRSREKLKED